MPEPGHKKAAKSLRTSSSICVLPTSRAPASRSACSGSTCLAYVSHTTCKMSTAMQVAYPCLACLECPGSNGTKKPRNLLEVSDLLNKQIETRRGIPAQLELWT